MLAFLSFWKAPSDPSKIFEVIIHKPVSKYKHYAFDNIISYHGKQTIHQEIIYIPNTIAKNCLNRLYHGHIKIWYHTYGIDCKNKKPIRDFEIIEAAIKEITKKDILEDTNNEPEILNLLSKEPEFIKMYGFHIDLATMKTIIALEWISGGDLFSYYEQHWKSFTIGKAKKIIKWLTTAMVKCHSYGICHCDIKLENIMLEKKNCLDVLKLIDFGSAKIVNSSPNIEYSFIGTSLHTTPPEIATIYKNKESSHKLMGESLFKIDVWQIGIIAYVLICGKYPFDASISNDIISQIMNKNISFPYNIPDLAKKFIQYATIKDPNTRPTMQELLEHKWLQL